MTPVSCTVASPVGPLVVVASDRGVRAIALPLPGRTPPAGRDEPEHPVLRRAADELRAYFAGERTDFTVPLDVVAGTAFQREVWDALRAIPYGETTTYGTLAAALGRPGAARAVGGANGANPVPIIVPCHRVVGADGAMTGYGGPSAEGIAMKRALLDLERGRRGRAAALR